MTSKTFFVNDLGIFDSKLIPLLSPFFCNLNCAFLNLLIKLTNRVTFVNHLLLVKITVYYDTLLSCHLN